MYSLMLRIRSLIIIQCLLTNQPYSKRKLFAVLEECGLNRGEIEEAYAIYAQERDGKKVSSSTRIGMEGAGMLLECAKGLMREIEDS